MYIFVSGLRRSTSTDGLHPPHPGDAQAYIYCSVRSLCVVCMSGTYLVSAGVAVLGVQRPVAEAAVRAALPHDVPLAAQSRLTLEAAEVLHVPVSALGLRALVRQDDLPDRQTERERDRQTDRQRERETDRQREIDR